MEGCDGGDKDSWIVTTIRITPKIFLDGCSIWGK